MHARVQCRDILLAATFAAWSAMAFVAFLDIVETGNPV
jgi:hypothetical protein